MAAKPIHVDEELQNYMPAPQATTDAELERQLIEGKGPSDAIVVWKETGAIVDGMRRYAICQKHGLAFRTRELSFKNKAAVKVWMARYAIARRNLTPPQYAHFLSDLVRQETEASGRGATKRVAEMVGVSDRTVTRATLYTKALDALEESVRAKIDSGELKAKPEEVIELSKLPALHQLSLVSRLETGAWADLREALFGEADEMEEGPATDEDDEDGYDVDLGGEGVKTDTMSVSTDEVNAQLDAVADVHAEADVSIKERKAERKARSKANRESHKKPSAKPASDMAQEATKTLGKLLREIHAINDAAPDDARMTACKRNLEYVGKALNQWWKEE